MVKISGNILAGFLFPRSSMMGFINSCVCLLGGNAPTTLSLPRSLNGQFPATCSHTLGIRSIAPETLVAIQIGETLEESTNILLISLQ